MQGASRSEFRGGFGADGPPGRSRPASTDEAMDAIERSRERIDEDLDAISDRIQAGRSRIDDVRQTLRGPVRQIERRPWAAVGIAFCVGLLAGVGHAVGRRELREESDEAGVEGVSRRERKERGKRFEEEHPGRSQLARGARKALLSATTAAMSSALVAWGKRLGRSVAEPAPGRSEFGRPASPGAH